MLPFGSPQYKIYKKSFLQRVVVVLGYEPIESNIKVLNNWKEFTKSTFFLETSGDFTQKKASVKSADNSLRFVFGNDKAWVRIQGIRYESFADTVIPHVYKLKEFFDKVQNGKNLNRLSIKKINAWKVDSDKELDTDFDIEMRKFCFSDAFMDYISEKSNLVKPDEDAANLLDCLCCTFREEGKSIKVASGFIPDLGKKEKVLVLDTECDYAGSIETKNVENELKKINYLLFQTFDWVASDAVKKLMDGEAL